MAFDLKKKQERPGTSNNSKVGMDMQGTINTIKGIISLARVEVVDKNVLKYFEMIEECSNVLNSNLKETVKAVSSNNYEPGRDLIDFDLLLEVVLDSLKDLEGFDQVTFKIRLQNKKQFHSDLQFMTSIFQNLIENAIKYRDITKPKSTVDITVFDLGDGVKIVIKDNGIGIKRKDQIKVFLKGYRSNIEVPGSGMGLYIVKKAVEMLNGVITMDSKINITTRMTLLIPNKALVGTKQITD